VKTHAQPSLWNLKALKLTNNISILHNLQVGKADPVPALQMNNDLWKMIYGKSLLFADLNQAPRFKNLP
jgi:hypothetical protein